jgi:biopolymer transport protein ExbB
MPNIVSTLLLGESSAVGSPVAIQSIWDFVVKGGPMMIPIILCSLFALSVFVERVVVLKKRSVIPPDFLDGLHAIMRDHNQTRKQALAYCEASASPLGAILAAGIKRLKEPVSVLEKHVQDAGERAVALMRKNLRVLTVVASVCPLMGLLGTIFGMIEAFQTVAASGEALGKTELLAEGIYQAMITTAAGLLVAIPVVIGYHYLSARIESLVAEMDRMTLDFLEEHAYAPKSGDLAPTNGDVVAADSSADADSSKTSGVRDAAIGTTNVLGA